MRAVRCLGLWTIVAALCGTAGCSGVAVSAPTKGTTPSSQVKFGLKMVSYDGVHVEVPAPWPVVDGVHTLLCGGPFPVTPTAFVGPNDNGAPICPAPRTLLPPPRDGVWLQRGSRPSTAPPSGAAYITTPDGQKLLEDLSQAFSETTLYWLHDVSVEIGIGPDPDVANRIFDSIGYAPTRTDTPARGACTRSRDSNVMPTPERLAKALMLERGDITLDPPTPSDHASMSPNKAWAESEPAQSFEHYRLILARYSARFPAEVGPHGLTPTNQNVLAWVVYSTPNTPISGCGGYGVEAFDAFTGESIGIMGYSPSP
jgi:hypothetical protein